MRIRRLGPEEIITTIDNTEKGCASCHWDQWSNNGGGNRWCAAAQAAYPHGSKATCRQWYRPKTTRKGGAR